MLYLKISLVVLTIFFGIRNILLEPYRKYKKKFKFKVKLFGQYVRFTAYNIKRKKSKNPNEFVFLDHRGKIIKNKKLISILREKIKEKKLKYEVINIDCYLKDNELILEDYFLNYLPLNEVVNNTWFSSNVEEDYTVLEFFHDKSKIEERFKDYPDKCSESLCDMVEEVPTEYYGEIPLVTEDYYTDNEESVGNNY
jgi:hypothetical protein